MAYGGGTFTEQNKILPGAYINFVSAARAASVISERGTAALPFVLDWGKENEVISVSADRFQDDCKKIFGYDYTHEKMKPLREVFKNATTLLCYRLGASTKAQNDFAVALCGGVRGNDIKIVIAANVDNPALFDVSTVLDTVTVDKQKVATATELTDNAYVAFKTAATLAPTAGTALTGGANATVVGGDYQAALDAFETYAFHCLGCPTDDEIIKAMFVAYTIRMREQTGVKFQTVGYQMNADYEGIISVENKTIDDNPAASVYWLTGAEAGCAVNKSCTNKKYDGEYEIETAFTQLELEEGMKTGKLMFHAVEKEAYVLSDINSLTTYTDDKNADFGSNQTIRVLDVSAVSIASLFNKKYQGKIPNDASGRASLWSDVVDIYTALQEVRAIEDFNSEDVSIERGESKKSVVAHSAMTPVNAMEKLYMTTSVS